MKRIAFILMILLFSCKKDKPVEYLLTVKTEIGGSISTTGGIFNKGETVTVTATPDSEYNFVGWNGTTSTDNPLTITLESDLVISPIFQKVKYSVSIKIEGEDDWGTVTEEIISSGKKTDYNSGTILKLTANPSSNYAFYNWNKNVLDTLNPYEITIDGNKEIDVKFDYEVGKSLAGTWELSLDTPNAQKNNNSQKSSNSFQISIDFGLNCLFVCNINGTTTSIFAIIKPIGTNALVLGNFGVLSNVSLTGGALSFKLDLVPTGTPTPTSVSNIPAGTSTNTINFSGTKSNNPPQKTPSGLLATPPSIPTNTSTSSLQAINSQAFTGAFHQITNIVSSTTASATTVSSTTATSTTASPCTGTVNLINGPASQTTDSSVAITEVVYQISTNCTDTTTVSATNLPPGINSTYTSSTGRVKLNGTTTSAATGTYDYSILVMYAPTSDATASSTVTGAISIASAAASSTTASPCVGTTTLISGPASQTTDSSVPITEVVYQISTNCTDTTTVSATNLPPGINSTYTSSTGRVKLNGTTTGAATGTYNYSILVMYAAADDISVATASSTVTGAISIAASSTTASPCAGSLTLASAGATINQTVSATTAITEIVYQISTNCTDTTTVSATNLPPGINSTYTSSTGRVKLNGTTTSAATGTYNYSIIVMYAPTSDATASSTVTGAISIAAAATVSPCAGTVTLASALGTDSQTVTASTVSISITEIVYQISTNCTDTTTVSATNLPPGITATFFTGLGRVKLNGTPTSTATGTYNYSVLVMYAPTSDATASSTVNGSISIAASSTTASPCAGSLTLASAGATINQTVSATTAITEIVYQISTNCTDTTTVSATNLPPGINSTYTSSTGRVKLNGTTTSAATGTYNYSIIVMYAPTSDATASSTVTGAISIAASSTTASPCAGSLTLASAGATINQTVSATTAITEIVYQISTNCTDTTTVSATNLPPGINSTYTSSTGRVKLNGTTTSAATGTYNYSIIVMYAPTSDATASSTVTGAISIAAAATVSPCAGSLTLASAGATINQTVSATTAITEIVYQISTNCTDTTTVSATNLPPGINSTYTSSTGRVKLNGTTTSAATGTYNYSIIVMYAPTSDATASSTVTGAISIATAATVSPCAGTVTLASALGTDSQTVTASTVSISITEIVYQISTNCTDTTTVSATNLPPGITATFFTGLGRVKLNGTPTSTATGTYNYSVLVMYAPTSDATASSTVTGAISIAATTASSTTGSATTYNIDVTATSSSDYTLNGSDRNGSISGSDPDLTFAIGDTINFNVDTTGHPFYLKTVQGTGTSDRVTGATNNGSENATVSWTPTTGGTYYYQCSLHAGMVGTITIQ